MKKKRPRSRPRASGVLRVPDALLASSLRGLGEGVVVFSADKDGGLRIDYANDQFCKMVGQPVGALAGQSHLVFHTDPLALARLKEWIRAGMKPGLFTDEGDLIGPGGRSLFAAWSLCRVRTPGGGKRTVVGCYRDITEKRHFEEALIHAQRLDAVGRMAGGVAHDFNNLISVINGYCQILLERAAGRDDVVQPLNEILRAGQKAATLTRQLLALGRRQHLSSRVIDLNALISENRDMLARVLGDAGTLEWSLSNGALLVRADPDQLQQVLLNLTLNARDALRDKGRVMIATSVREVTGAEECGHEHIPAGRYALLSVADNGTGMDAETLAHLFEPFFTTKEPGKGSGLGLALSYGVVRQSGGRIAVHSALLVGSTFEILLPLVEGARAEAGQIVLSGSTSAHGNEQVLLIEGDDVVGKMAAGMLASESYRVFLAHDSREADQVLAEQKLKVDVFVAEIGGDAACQRLVRRLRKAQPAMRVLCTHGCGERCPLGSGAACEATLPKPFAMSELLQAVRVLIDR